MKPKTIIKPQSFMAKNHAFRKSTKEDNKNILRTISARKFDVKLELSSAIYYVSILMELEYTDTKRFHFNGT